MNSPALPGAAHDAGRISAQVEHRYIGQLQPLSKILKPGVSARCLRRIESYRRRHAKKGAAVGLLTWPDGTWCILAMHPGPLPVVVLSDQDKADAYKLAGELIGSGQLPLLALMFGGA